MKSKKLLVFIIFSFIIQIITIIITLSSKNDEIQKTLHSEIENKTFNFYKNPELLV